MWKRNDELEIVQYTRYNDFRDEMLEIRYWKLES